MKKLLLFFGLLGAVLFFGRMTAGAEEIKAEFPDLTAEQAAKITDGEYGTVYKSDNLSLTVKCGSPIKAAYIIWYENPADYTVSAGEESFSFDGEMLHKLIVFKETKNEFTINCPEGGSICDVYVFENTDFPDFVQQWEEPCKQADMLILSAHADDEYLMFGGTIPYYAKELGLKVQVAYMTTHYQEQPRPHELLDGLWAAGVKNYPVIGIIPDIPFSPIWSLEEAKNLYDYNSVLDWFIEQIRRFKPSVIITHDKDGEYGHGAHQMAASIVMDAVRISYDPEQFPASAEKYGVWNVPKTYLHFWKENAITMDWERTLDSFGGMTAREAAEYCYGFHKSQHIWTMSVNYGPEWDCRQFGLYRTMVGVDEKADFMDHIEPLAEETTVTETESSDTESSDTESSETESSDTESSDTESSETESSETESSETESSETSISEEQSSTSETSEETSQTTAEEENKPGNILLYVGGGILLVVIIVVVLVIVLKKGAKNRK